ncbi:glycoside hydrolase family 3 protein [Halalkalibacterium halodurans]|uniref:Glucan 1,4-beta-glucosidase n=3 Tax=Halalkalibacterium halodurans TaxID=86665 RepID=Q9KBL8_HALH5|nr:glucan 1,4-beta-glucosidase [Halalkalibacterium halodurans C-125]
MKIYASDEQYKQMNEELDERVESLVSELTLDEKIRLMCQYQEAVPRLGIGKYKHGTEGAHGVAWLGKATVFPQNIGLGCTWNEELMKKIGDVIAEEARVYYQENPEQNGLTIWAPTVDMERDPRWGRTEEAYGEDPYLTGKLTTELIKGMQGDHPFYLKTAATLKHFLANNNEEARTECSVSIDPRNLREYYLKAFEPQVKEGHVQCVMTAYNAVNGTLCNMNPDVNAILKEEWGLQGFVVSDACDVVGSVDDHQFVESYAEAVALSIKNGIDNVTDDEKIIHRAIGDALEQGLLSEEDLDQALKRVFRVRIRLGEFDQENKNPYATVAKEKLCAPEHSELALQAAKEAIVLLKNDDLLPLSPEKKVAVIGPLANEIYTDWYSGTPPYTISPLEGIMQKANEPVLYADGSDRIRLREAMSGNGIVAEEGSSQLTCHDGQGETFIHTDWGWGSETLQSQQSGKYVTLTDEGVLAANALEVKGWFVKELLAMEENDHEVTLHTWDRQQVKRDESERLSVNGENDCSLVKDIVERGIDQAVEAAKQADTAVVFVGNQPYINGKECVDRPDLALPPAQQRLIEEVVKVNRNTVVVIVGSYPYTIPWVKENVPAIVYTAHGGQEFGRAVSDVLFGDYNPAGRLNMTWYLSANQLPDMMDYDIIKGKRTYQYFEDDVLYPFGHGLSYARFSYDHLQIQKTNVLTVSATITNTSHLDGEEVVQLYVRCQTSRVKRPLKTLKGFKRLMIKRGEQKVVTFTLEPEELAIWDVTRERYCVEQGMYTIMLGRSSKDIQLEETIELEGEVIPARLLSTKVKALNYDDYHNVLIDRCVEGGESIRGLGDGSWIAFHDINLEQPTNLLTVRAANENKQAVLEIRADRVDGPLVSQSVIPPTGGLQAWTTVTAQVNGETSEIRDLYLVFKGEFQLSWFSFS